MPAWPPPRLTNCTSVTPPRIGVLMTRTLLPPAPVFATTAPTGRVSDPPAPAAIVKWPLKEISAALTAAVRVAVDPPGHREGSDDVVGWFCHALGDGSEGRGRGRRAAAVGAVPPPARHAGPPPAAVRPPVGRRGGRRPERLPQLLPGGRRRPLPAAP